MKKVINFIKVDLQLALTLLAQGTKEGLETLKTNENSGERRKAVLKLILIVG